MAWRNVDGKELSKAVYLQLLFLTFVLEETATGARYPLRAAYLTSQADGGHAKWRRAAK